MRNNTHHRSKAEWAFCGPKECEKIKRRGEIRALVSKSGPQAQSKPLVLTLDQPK